MALSLGKTRRGVAKLLGIKLQDKNPWPITDTGDLPALVYEEEPPTVGEWLHDLLPTPAGIFAYLLSLFPFLKWIHLYNWQWLIGDLVAGITVGGVVVPQGMAYATLANLAPEFGLYSSFMGVLIYWFFATSKDITIGPAAVMSTVVGNVVSDLQGKVNIEAHFIASALAILAGSIVLFIGLIRCGWIVDLLPLTSLSAFMTGSAISVGISQLPTLMGIKTNTREAAYLVFINTLRGLPNTKLDAAMGLSALFMLYLIRSVCSAAAKKRPRHAKAIFFISTLRTVFVILLYTMISWLVNRNEPHDKAKFKILFDVPPGFQHATIPEMNAELASLLAPHLPASIIVILIEHIAISKSFGRINNYTIDPSQEMVAIGVTNLLGPFLGGYPSTGSFSRTAIKSKAGVRTPFAGVITAVVVLLAIYALTSVFYYIPSALLSAVIIHAIGDLITPPNTIYEFWRVSPLEVVIFFVGIIVTLFSSIENGIYVTLCMSIAMLLFRILKAKGSFLGRVKVQSMLDNRPIGTGIDTGGTGREYGTFVGAADASTRSIFLPLSHGDGSNPEVALESPYPGIFIYRFSEGFSYPNAFHSLEHLTGFIFQQTRRTNITTYDRPGDRPWNDPGPSRRKRRAALAAGISPASIGVKVDAPTLKAIILDFSSVNNVDITSIQTLIDVRNQLDRYTAPNAVDWHFACINNRWTKRALVSAGFGYPVARGDADDNAVAPHRWRSLFSVAEIGGDDSAAAVAKRKEGDREKGLLVGPRKPILSDIDSRNLDIGDDRSSSRDAGGSRSDMKKVAGRRRIVPVHALNRPLFYVDLTSALQAAIANVEARAQRK